VNKKTAARKRGPRGFWRGGKKIGERGTRGGERVQGGSKKTKDWVGGREPGMKNGSTDRTKRDDLGGRTKGEK